MGELASALDSVQFYHADTARSTDQYVYKKMLVSYIEPDNVTCTQCRWSTPGMRPNRGFSYLWQRQKNGTLTNPPMGIRSSPPLGGLGAGSVELRADGTFREWTIFNQGPAGSGKFGVCDDAMIAARVNGVSKPLRTHPPQSLPNVAGVDALRFSGSYPVTRLHIEDSTLLSSQHGSLSVYGYSILRPSAPPETWAHPALTLSMHVKNLGAQSMDVDLMLAVPMGGWTDCSREGKNGTRWAGATTAAECSEC